MKVLRFTPKARESLQHIAQFLIVQTSSKAFVRKHLDDFHASLSELLSRFPEAGVQVRVDQINCRRIVVSGYSVLYLIEAGKRKK